MLYFLVALIALSAIIQCNSFIRPLAGVHCLDDSCPGPSTYNHHGYHNTTACPMDDISFPNLVLTLENNSMKSIWHNYYIHWSSKTHNTDTGLMTHRNFGPMTHNFVGHVTQLTYHASFIPCGYGIISISLSNKLHQDVTVVWVVTKTKTYQPHECEYIIIIPPPHNLSEHMDSYTTVYKQWCSEPSLKFDQKPQKYYKCSPLRLIWAINLSIYYLFNGTFDHAHDVNHLINQLLLKLRQYITRHNDFKYLWITLLLLGLSSSQHISLSFLIIFFWRIKIIACKLSWFQKLKYMVYMTIDKLVVLYVTGLA